MDELLASLERRVAHLEQEIRDLKADLHPPSEETSAQRGERLFRQARETKPLSKTEMQQLLQELGLPWLESKTPEQLQQELLAAGIRPEDNAFSKGIIEMREE